MLFLLLLFLFPLFFSGFSHDFRASPGNQGFCSQGAHDASPAFPACPGERRSQGATIAMAAMAHVEMANNG